MATAQLGDITVGYDDEGSGDALLLVHGHPFDRSMWAPQTAVFAREGYRVIAPDLRGYGESGVGAGDTGFSDYAHDLAALLDHLGLGRAVLGGLSMGGQIVMEFCRLYPERLRAVVLADTSPQAETEAGKQWRRDLADRVLREGVAGYADEVLDKMVAPYNIETQPDVAGHVSRMMHAAPPEGAAAALRARAERPDYLETLRALRVPALVVVGADDPYTPVADAELIQQSIPGAVLTVVAGAAHMPNLEQPAEFDAALRSFLAGLG